MNASDRWLHSAFREAALDVAQVQVQRTKDGEVWMMGGNQEHLTEITQKATRTDAFGFHYRRALATALNGHDLFAQKGASK